MRVCERVCVNECMRVCMCVNVRECVYVRARDCAYACMCVRASDVFKSASACLSVFVCSTSFQSPPQYYLAADIFMIISSCSLLSSYIFKFPPGINKSLH